MAIKTTLMTRPKENPELTYPCLVKATGRNDAKLIGLIVLAINDHTGIVIAQDTGSFHSIGYYSIGWVPFTDKTVWEVLKHGDSVTLTQE